MSLQTSYQPTLPPLFNHPRPQCRREDITILNGLWDYCINQSSDHYTITGQILVPFSPETMRSNVNRQLMPGDYLHYQTYFTRRANKRCLLHFDAVDERCVVYLNKHLIGSHDGGYLAFCFDITDYLEEYNTLYVRVQDDTDTSYHARGKQKLIPKGMYYHCQSGIWQSVWLEWVSDDYITDFKLYPSFKHEQLGIQVTCPVSVTADLYESEGDNLYARLIKTVTLSEHTTAISLKDHVHPWSPEHPYLYGLILHHDHDEVKSYFALRDFSTIKTQSGLFFSLNGKPCFYHGVLDQGYYPESLMTPPTDEAMVNDILLVKAMGFNTIRRHVNVAPMRWYYHCDRLGVVVFQDVVNGGTSYHDSFVTYMPNLLTASGRLIKDSHYKLFGRENPASRDEYIKQLKEMIDQLFNVVSIALWVPFNEGWGQFNAKLITSLIKEWDQTRLVDSTSGWFDQRCGDVYSIHNYFHTLHVRPGKRVVALTEYGGYNYRVEGSSATKASYGYKTIKSREQLMWDITELIQRDIIANIPHGLSAAILTQLSDIESEVNGLITYDRKVIKYDIRQMKQIRWLIDTAMEKIKM